MKTLVALLGGQISPVYHSIKDVNPEKLILVYTQETRNLANDLLKLDFPFQVIGKQIDAYNVELIRQSAIDIVKELKDDGVSSSEITLNYTGSTKLIAIAFFEIFKEIGAVLWYLNSVENQAVVFEDYGIKITKKKLFSKLTIDEWFRLKKETIYHHTDFDPSSKMIEFAEEIFNEIENKQLKKFRTSVFKFLNDKSKTETSEFLSEYNSKNINIVFKNRDYELIIHGSSYKSFFKNRKDLLFYISGGWFEYLVANAIHKTSKFNEILINVKVSPRSFHQKQDFDKNSKDELLRNEFDILMLENTTLTVVECKADMLKQPYLDKLVANRGLYGDSFSRGLMVCLYKGNSEVNDKLKQQRNIDLITINPRQIRSIEQFYSLFNVLVRRKNSGV